MKPFLVFLVCVVGWVGCGKKDTSVERVEFTTPNSEKVSDLKKADGNVRWEVRSGENVPLAAKALHDKARAAGEAGKYDEALKLLAQANAAAPKWAYPVYDMAHTYLLKDDFTNALAKYREVDVLEPSGFFTTKTALWTLEREAKGELPNGAYRSYLSLEFVPRNEKSNLVAKLSAKLPDYPPLLKERALLAETSEEKLKLIQKGISLNPDADTFGILMLNKAAELHNQNKTSEAKAIVQSLITDTNTVGTKSLARELLKHF